MEHFRGTILEDKMNKDKIKWKGDSFESLGRWLKTEPGQLTNPIHEPKGITTIKKSIPSKPIIEEPK